MTLGAGIAIATIWICATCIALHKSIPGLGWLWAVIAACIATYYISGGARP